jgi:hypothetical protein
MARDSGWNQLQDEEEPTMDFWVGSNSDGTGWRWRNASGGKEAST